YNGYSWDGERFVYNPFSVLNFLEEGRFKPYWMATGSPEFIVEYAKGVQLDISAFEGMKVYDSFMEKKDIDAATPESFLMQAGYLTIKGYSDNKYTLGFPNQEVRRTFSDLLITGQYDVKDSDILSVAENLTKALGEGDTEEIVNQFKVIFSSIPYMYFDSNKSEHFYSAVLLMYLQAAGFDADPERIGNKGRLDLSIKFENHVYIFELKTDKPSVAIQQIREKNYGGKYANYEVINIGLKIDFVQRNIVDWKVEV
ncbi:MAG: PD-(D/E)XK nuclease domain-containing protein, partial [Exilibacterium sp.]